MPMRRYHRERLRDEDEDSEDFDCREGLYRTRRDGFRSNEIAMNELAHWKARDNEMEYKFLSGFIPPDFIGKNPSGSLPFAKTDTWFSEYDLHNPPSMILSESPQSLIVGNLVSYDSRQYPQWFDPTYEPGINTPEGQAFGHCFVIPRKRVFNIVDPDADAALLKEMREHFVRCWNTEDGKDKMINRIRAAVESQNEKLMLSLASFQKKQDPDDDNNNDDAASTRFLHLRDLVWQDFQTLAHDFRTLNADDFVYAFHAWPDNSIGHLHMHVFPAKDSLRRFSTRRHDWKTISLECVLRVEEEEEED